MKTKLIDLVIRIKVVKEAQGQIFSKELDDLLAKMEALASEEFDFDIDNTYWEER